MYTAFFDLDHTILSTSSGKIMLKGSYEHGIIGKKEIFKAIIINILYRTGILSSQSAVERWLQWYVGMSIEMVAPIAMEWVEELNKFIREDARRELKLHRDNGARTVILSASTTYICEQIKNTLDMDDILCTEIEVIDGSLTGKLKGRYCYGEEKLIRARQYCQEKGMRMEDAYYYADSIADLPVLESVGNPVCVTPDKKLERIARKRGWEIYHWR
ncbi:MAG: hypothetical protein A2176_07355 [Spirochaetes bacterium RBG_13_51_14]|nr:MAG: hypothetical protein A2176_07355 [Spirochaetes bacterium RBG_13_51_14]